MHFYIDKKNNKIYYRETYGDLEFCEISTDFYNQILNLFNKYKPLLTNNNLTNNDLINNNLTNNDLTNNSLTNNNLTNNGLLYHEILDHGLRFAYHLTIYSIIMPFDFVSNPDTYNIINKYYDKFPDQKIFIESHINELYQIANTLNNKYPVATIIDSDPRHY